MIHGGKHFARFPRTEFGRPKPLTEILPSPQERITEQSPRILTEDLPVPVPDSEPATKESKPGPREILEEDVPKRRRAK